MSWHKPVGVIFLVLALATFVLMAYGLVKWGPIAATMMLLWMGFGATGSVLISHRPAGPAEPAPGPYARAEPERMEPEVRGGMGSGYCPECGSPLMDGDIYCGVCGRRL